MTVGIQSAASGALAFQRKVDATANNLANLNSDGYQRVRVDLEAGDPAGVQAVARRDTSPGPRTVDPAEPAGEPRQMSNVDPATELTDLMVGEHGFAANLKVLQTADEMLGSLLDTMG